MSYETALQRVGELRGLVDRSPTGSATSPAAASTSATFQTALAQQQASIGLTASDGSTVDVGMSEFGVPVLTVADQYRLMGLPVPTTTGAAPIAPGSGSVGQRIVALAQQELAAGVTESGGNNESTRIREYRSATVGAEDTPGPWCAYFVSWLAKTAGAPVGASGNGTGYVPTLEAWGKQEGRYTARGAGTPNPGDIVIINWGGRGVADHTGIVEKVDPDGTVHTIEGNSSDAINRRSYSATSSDLQGFVRVG